MDPLLNRYITAMEVPNSKLLAVPDSKETLKNCSTDTTDPTEVGIQRLGFCPGNSMSHKMETVEHFRLKCCFFQENFIQSNSSAELLPAAS